ncbi:nuclease [Streptomyces lunaelactis]|uniref:nuclease n=1 Tax=Streptomyces lunaelactis TaxID=1535768 RepID=UPI0015853E43|nr:nuclease [Streptomyces lunaelactis]NUL04758.1 nuclease [Streptomyces lunaelactis]
MPMLLIKGSFQVIGTQPDGDTVHFTPDNPAEWDLVGGIHEVKRNASGRGKLRLDAVDALETHYSRTGPVVHQPLPFAHAARDELLTWLGFTDVQRQPNETVTATTPESVPGWILTRSADIGGRCIALVGRGEHPDTSGTEIFVDVPLLKTTANHHLLTAGLAYPTYYRNLFPDLRAELTAAVHLAQAAPAKGLWPKDVTTRGATITGMSSLTTDVVILPKLFRRLVDYLNLGDPDLAGFPAFLAQAKDRYFILSAGHFTIGLDEVVKVINSKVQMTHPAEDLIFEET